MSQRRHPNVIHIDEVTPREPARGRFGFRGRRLGPDAGGRALGCTHIELAPGKTAFPNHWHSAIEEGVYVLEGTGVMRIGDARVDIKPGDYIALPPGPTTTHQLTNTGATPMRYLALSAPAAATTMDVVVYPDSVVKFGQDSVSLQRGSVSVATSKRMVATVGEVTATPASDVWTEFEVADTNGSIRITASKGTTDVSCPKGSASLSEGDELTADAAGNCTKKKRKAGALWPGHGGTLSGPWVITGGLITVGGVICLLLCDNPQPFISQWKP